jgi:hypothetical protein
MPQPKPTYSEAQQAAIAAGLKKFDPGQLCSHGHHSLRFVSGGCCECVALNRKASPPARRQKLPPRELKRRAIIDVEARRKKLSRLPRKASHDIQSYQYSAQSRKNSKHLDSLIKVIR